MHLFPHNQLAYANAVHILRDQKRTCIIHPTGTGKAVIISRFIMDNPSRKHLVLAPGKHIHFEIESHVKDVPVCFWTYQALSEETIKPLTGYDYIYLDEFHRIGAEIWGECVFQVLVRNPRAKVVGTSATPIRYLDGARDMSQEIFGNNIASQISLNQAFGQGILRPPKYISALYSIAEEYERLAKKVLLSKHKDKKILASQLKQNVIDWEHSSGIDAVVKKHLPKDRDRIIVFCQNFDGMKMAEELLMPIFISIFGKAMPIHVHSNFSTAHNNSALREFRADDNQVKILFARDKLNEGLHGKKFNTLFLLRETISPTIFYQQIGRCFSINQEERPIIFDLVNNFRNIRLKQFKKEFEEETRQSRFSAVHNQYYEITDSPSIEFIDETQGIRDLITAFSNGIENWEIFFKKAQKYFLDNGDLYVANSDLDLKKWLQSQRAQFKDKSLLPGKIRRLSEIGMDWEFSYKPTFLSQFNKLKNFMAAFGKEPNKTNDLNLATWLHIQRVKIKEGSLKKSHVKLLETLVPVFGTRREIDWKEKVDKMKVYHRDKKAFVWKITDPIYLIASNIRAAYKANTLPEKHRKELEEIGFPFKTRNDWNEMYTELREFITINKKTPTAKEDFKLHNWLRNQIKRHRKKTLSIERVNLLRSAGINLKIGEKPPREIKWVEEVDQLIAYFTLTGGFKWNKKDPISRVAEKIRAVWRSGNLPSSQLEKLQNIKFPFTYQLDWEEFYSQLEEWVKIHQKTPTLSKHERLHTWMRLQITEFRKGKLPPEKARRLAALGVQLKKTKGVAKVDSRP